MLFDLTNVTATIRRAATSDGKQVYADLYTGVSCRLEPASDQTAAINEVKFGQAFKVFFDRVVDIQTADQLVIDGVTYQVRGVKDMLGVSSSLSHKDVLAVRSMKS